ncbi:hypothetical protein scyTo_0018424, partial [Scyliorhinus torazame]|nr:hypothetical protein [Scyliorhinus torazame]
FSNLLGTVYRQGNLNYSPDGNSVISPVGNRVTVFDLKNNKSETLPFAAQRNLVCVGQSPDGHLAILVDEEGAALLVSLISKSVLHHFHFHTRVHSVSFSPDGRRFVVSKENVVLMYHAPGKTREFNPFVLDKSYFGPYDETTCIDWTDDSKHFFNKEKDFNDLTAAAYHKKTHLLVTGFASGIFHLHELPEFNLIHSLSISDRRIESISINVSGDWIAFGCPGVGQLLVWEWQSESYVLKQQGHFNNMVALSYSPDAQYIVTGGDDGKVKVWNTSSGFCIVTFTEHTSSITAVTFNSTGFVLAGHEGPVSSLSFSPTHTLLASASWDKTVKLWDMFDSWKTKETFVLNSDVLDVAFRPDGKELAVVTLDGQITFWDHQNAVQTGSIEGRHDLQMGRKELDKITAKQAAKGRSFSTLCYSADGQSVLAGGRSKFVCIYNVKEQLLVKKFEISCNLSLDAMEEFLDRRKMTEFGSLALIDDGAGDENGVVISLPGVKKGDMSSRHFKPEIRVTCLRFAPTGRSWAATSTEGLLIFSLDGSVVFDPFDLDEDVTPSSVRHVLRQKEFTTAIMMAFRLNEDKLTLEVLESVPHEEIDIVCSTLPLLYAEKLLQFVASALETSRHLEFYLTWAQRLLTLHGQKLKSRSVALLPMIQSLQKSIQHHFDAVSKL